MSLDGSISSIRAAAPSVSTRLDRGQGAGEPFANAPEASSEVSRPGVERKPELPEVVRGLNDALRMAKRVLQFHIDTDSGRTVVQVIDQETDEIIRQIPPEELLAIVKYLDQDSGLIVRGQA